MEDVERRKRTVKRNRRKAHSKSKEALKAENTINYMKYTPSFVTRDNNWNNIKCTTEI